MTDFMDEDWLDELVSIGQRLHFPAGQIFHHAGEAISKIYLVVSGTVEIWHTSSDGKEVWLGSCTPGDVLGSTALISDELSAFDWLALSNIGLIAVSPDNFLSLADKRPEMVNSLYGRLSDLLNETRKAFILAQTKNAKQRIFHELLRLSDVMGMEPNQRVIRPNPIITDIARRSNTTRETVSRTVSQLCKSGVLKREPGAMLLLEPTKLEQD